MGAKQDKPITILSYGGGTNSTAIIVGMWDRAEPPPDYITFADTGNEKPHTYEHIEFMQNWLPTHGWPKITILMACQPKQIESGTLYGECMRLGTMPSRLYGMGSCSEKWKVDPQRKFTQLVRRRRNVLRLIGFDADEEHRVQRAKCEDYESLRFPLVEWGWGREECIEAIKGADIPLPGKSACWMCPSSTKKEVLELAQRYPELAQQAIAMERRALAGEGQSPAARVKGLGRHWAWEDLIAKEGVGDEFTDACLPSPDCMCADG